MSLFCPTRSSTPPRARNTYGSIEQLAFRRESLPISPARAFAAPELTGLTDLDVEILDDIIGRADPTSSTFLTIFKAYSDVLQERGMDTHEVVFYGKLLKLGTLRGESWMDKWESVKRQHGYDHSGARAPTAQPATSRHVHSPDDPFQSPARSTPHALLQAEGASSSHRRKALKPDPPPLDLADNSLGLHFSPPKPASLTRERVTRSRSNHPPGSDASGLTSPSNPPSYKASFRDTPLLRQEDIKITSKNKVRTSARDLSLTRQEYLDPSSRQTARERVGRDRVLRRDPFDNRDGDEKRADAFKQARLLAGCWDVWKEGYKWIIVSAVSG
jgi:protein SFI1